MSRLPLEFLLPTVAGWMIRDPQRVTEHLLAENVALRRETPPPPPPLHG